MTPRRTAVLTKAASRFTVTWFALALVALTIPAATASTSDEDEAAEATKILIVGDSITQGSVGDYTWRYFTWQHLVQAGAEVDFVGPNSQVYVARGASWPASYADARFDRDHAATWGDRMVYKPLHDRAALVDAYTPDVVVLALGTNDLRYGWSVAVTVKAVRTWVSRTREQRPETDFVLVEVPGAPLRKAARFNRRLAKAAKALDHDDSRVTVAKASVGFRRGTGHRRVGDTYDPHHPNTRGQLRIAAAVADGLAELDLGEPYARPLVHVPEGPRARPSLRATRTGKRTARLAWTVPPGATSFDVFVKRGKKAWRKVRVAHPRSKVRVRGLRACRTYAFKVRARKGWTLAHRDMTSRVRTVRPSRKCN